MFPSNHFPFEYTLERWFRLDDKKTQNFLKKSNLLRTKNMLPRTIIDPILKTKFPNKPTQK